jgi:hypothetical protein
MSEFKELQTILIFNVVHVNWQDVLSYITVDQTCKYSLDNVFPPLFLSVALYSLLIDPSPPGFLATLDSRRGMIKRFALLDQKSVHVW